MRRIMLHERTVVLKEFHRWSIRSRTDLNNDLVKYLTKSGKRVLPGEIHSSIRVVIGTGKGNRHPLISFFLLANRKAVRKNREKVYAGTISGYTRFDGSDIIPAAHFIS